ncbi:ketopantoate reductase family protein [Paraburkholderia phytofirmans]|uniref:ketopantoate reductase family protein n=1 Tax=Paraburkholderia phytofirmans TaxID=261302 RepID=UPI001F2C8F85|nr:2-dehydropantoate 2-reductase N-terminal domain-containing protein [Paraburkholderia phytofirmans]
MKILVLGAGAIGAYYGARLIQARADSLTLTYDASNEPKRVGGFDSHASAARTRVTPRYRRRDVHERLIDTRRVIRRTPLLPRRPLCHSSESTHPATPQRKMFKPSATSSTTR